jgi:hypothetical protein
MDLTASLFVRGQLTRKDFVAGKNIRYEPVKQSGGHVHQAFFVREVDGHGELKIHPIIPGAVSITLKREAITRQHSHLFDHATKVVDAILRPEWPEDRYDVWERMIVFSGGSLADTLQFGEPPAAMEGFHIMSVRWRTRARAVCSPLRPGLPDTCMQGNHYLMTLDTGGMTNAMAFQRFSPETREPLGPAEPWVTEHGGLWIDNQISKVLLRAYERKTGTPPTHELEQAALLMARQLKEDVFQIGDQGIPTLGEIRRMEEPEPGLSIVLAALQPSDLPDHMKSM